SALSQCPRETVFAVVGLKEGGDFIEIEKRRDEISLLEEELVQLTLKSSQVVPNENPTLICSFWTQKSYNPDSFRAQLKSIWKPKKKFEIQDLLHAIGSTFGGVIRLEIKWEFCQLWAQLDAQKPVRRGIFISTDGNVKEVKVEETLRYSFRRRFTIQLTIGLWESFLANIVTDNLRRDLGDSNMVSSPLIEGISTKLRDSFESIVADVGMDFEIGEEEVNDGKKGELGSNKDNENDEFLPDGEGNKKLKFRNEEPVVSMLPDAERTTLEYHSTLFIIGPRPATRQAD
ncbi:hypothetical protein Gorai_023280, partial [Gossypium raimondii]|nr:hypothetical protein [Gossypium raimondii]